MIMADNEGLYNAKMNKNDEFYTQQESKCCQGSKKG